LPPSHGFGLHFRLWGKSVISENISPMRNRVERKNTNFDRALSRLQRAEGIFPCDPSSRAWRLLFIFAGWIIIPSGVLWCLVYGKNYNNGGLVAVLCTAALLFCGLVWGHVAWLQKDHRYEIRGGVLFSVDRRVLWKLRLSEIQGIREYRSGSFSVWWLRTATRARGIVIYRSLHRILETKN